MDLAEIGLKADSSEITKADTALDKFASSARGAEVATDRFNKEQDQGARATSRFRNEVNLTGKGMSFIKGALGGALIALTAFVGAGALMKNFVDNTIEAQGVQAQLAAALRSTGGASGQTIESLNANAVALQKVTNFGDEAIGTMQSLLLTFTKISGDVFPRATEAIANVAQRMGGDLQGAALQVGKALNNPIQGITALGRAGIQFTDKQKEMITSMMEANNILGAQNIILKELENQFGGSARAARETLGGAITSLGNAWGDLFEMAGPASEMLRLSIESLITAIQSPAFMAFVQMIGVALFNSLTMAVNMFSMLATIVPPVFNTIYAVLEPLGPLFLAVFGPAAVSVVLTLTTAIGTSLYGAISGLFVLILANPFTALIAGIVAVLSYFVDWELSIRNVIQAFAALMVVWHSTPWGSSGGKDYWIRVGIDAGTAVEELKAAAIEIKDGTFRGFEAGGMDAGGKIKEAMAEGGDTAAQKIGGAMTNDQAKAIFEGFNGKVIKPLGDTLVEGGDYIYNQVTGAVTQAGPDIASSLTAGGENVGGAISNAMGQGSSTVYNSIESAFATLGPLQEVFDAFWMKWKAETALLRAQTAQILAEIQLDRQKWEQEYALRLRGRWDNNGGGGGGGGGYGGGGGNNNELPIDPWEMRGWNPAAELRKKKGKPWDVKDHLDENGYTPMPPGPDAPKKIGGPEGRTPTGAGLDKTPVIINQIDPRMALDALSTKEGYNVFRNIIKTNRDELRGMLGTQ